MSDPQRVQCRWPPPVCCWRWICGLLLAVSACHAAPATQGGILTALPDSIEPSLQYVIYLHGAIVEGTDRRPTHPRFGPYEYDRILEALSAPRRLVISIQRPRGARVEIWAERTATQVEKLLAAGVSPSAITVVGFSKGGAIAILTSDRVAESRVRYVLMGACGAWLSQRPDLRLHGQVLSLVEASDTIGTTCEPLFDRSPEAHARQILLHTGLEHGTFYQPRTVWLKPARNWIDGGEPGDTSENTGD